MESKLWHQQTYLLRRNRLTDIENRLEGAKGWEREGPGLWDLQMYTVHIGWINNKAALLL